MNNTPFCVNLDFEDFANRKFKIRDPHKTTLIMIGDHGQFLPFPAKDYVPGRTLAETLDEDRTTPGDWSKAYRFNFLDDSGEYGGQSMSRAHAAYMVQAILGAWERKDDLVVHCYVGVSRSGAVVEFAKGIGFEPIPGVYRSPNERVLEMLNLEYSKL